MASKSKASRNPNDAVLFLKDIQDRIRADALTKKLLTIVICVMAFCWAGSTVWLVWQDRVESGRQPVYVVDRAGGSVQAEAADPAAFREMECISHLTRFHELLLNVTPNIETINSRVDQAYNMADNCVKRFYDMNNENHFYSDLVREGHIQDVTVDSVRVDVGVRPYRARVWLTKRYVRPASMTVYSMMTECSLLESRRSRTNPSGLLVSDFHIVSETKLRSVPRRR